MSYPNVYKYSNLKHLHSMGIRMIMRINKLPKAVPLSVDIRRYCIRNTKKKKKKKKNEKKLIFLTLNLKGVLQEHSERKTLALLRNLGYSSLISDPDMIW